MQHELIAYHRLNKNSGWSLLSLPLWKHMEAQLHEQLASNQVNGWLLSFVWLLILVEVIVTRHLFIEVPVYRLLQYCATENIQA